MIDGFTITYPRLDSTIANYQPPNEVLNAFLVAMLTTILSYQLAAIIFDILLGFKKPGQATASDISTLILTEDSSLLSIMASLSISRTISRWKFHGFRSSRNIECNHGCHGDHRRVRIPAKVLFKFFVLLIAAPFASTLAVFLTVERDIPVKFRDVDFGGIAFGLNSDLSTPIYGDTSQVCVSFGSKLSRLESPLAEFSVCFLASIVIEYNNTDLSKQGTFRMSHGPEAESSVIRLPRDAILIQFLAPPRQFTVVMHADLKTPEGVFRVKEAVNLTYARRLFENGVVRLARACFRNELAEQLAQQQENGTLDIVEERREESWFFEWQIDDCIVDDPSIREFLDQEMAKFTLTDSADFRVLELDGSGRELRGDDLVFLNRRRSFATFAVLCITVLVVVAVRIIIRVFTNNDVHLGIELVLKDSLRINRCDSMLQNNREVDYSAQVYEGLEHRGNSLTVSDWEGSGTLDGRTTRI